MKYFAAIVTLITLNIFVVITLLYFGSLSKLTEQKNKQLEFEILKYNKQLKINEVEYSLYNNLSYLKKLQEIYFDVETKNLSKYNRISLQDFENSDLKNVYRVSSN